MSIEDKRRAAFEAAFKLPDGMYWDEKQRQYAGGVMFWLYTDRLQVWSAALDSVVVALPTDRSLSALDDPWYVRDMCQGAIEAAGLKVAP